MRYARVGLQAVGGLVLPPRVLHDARCGHLGVADPGEGQDVGGGALVLEAPVRDGRSPRTNVCELAGEQGELSWVEPAVLLASRQARLGR